MEEWLDLPDLVEKAQDYLEIGFVEDALNLLNEYNDIYGDEWAILFIYSRIYTELDNVKESIKYLHRCYKIERDNVDCLIPTIDPITMLNNIGDGFINGEFTVVDLTWF